MINIRKTAYELVLPGARLRTKIIQVSHDRRYISPALTDLKQVPTAAQSWQWPGSPCSALGGG